MLKYFLILFLGLTLSVFTEDKLKMKTGSFMAGEVIKVTEKGILFKLNGMEKLIDLQWDVIDDDCKAELIKKHGLTKEEAPAGPEQSGPEGQRQLPAKPLTSNINEMTTIAVVVDYPSLARDIYTSYMTNLKAFARDAVEGMDFLVADGIQIKTKDGRLLRGILVKESPTETVLKFNDLPLTILKENIFSSEKTVLKMKRGNLDIKDMQKYAETTMHENSLRLAAFEIGVTFEQAKYIWSVRGSGGVLPTPEGEKTFLPHKTIRSIDLGESSFLFGDANSASGLKSFPTAVWWNLQQSIAKENILLAINALKNFPKHEWLSRSCAACRGEGVIKSVEYGKGDNKPKDPKVKDPKIKDPKTTQPKEPEAKPKTCTVCSGMKKVYTLKYE